MIRITSKGLTILETLENLSESDIRLLGYIANEKSAFEKNYVGLNYIGFSQIQIQRLQELGYLREG